jgi:hypothetical protein
MGLNFKVKYKDEMEILDYAISDLNSIANLVESQSYF